MCSALPSSELFSSSLEKVMMAFLRAGRFWVRLRFRRVRDAGVTKSSSVLAGLRGWRHEPAKKKRKKIEQGSKLVCRGEEKSLGVSAGLQDWGKAGISQKERTSYWFALGWHWHWSLTTILACLC